MEATQTKTKWSLDTGHSEVVFKVKHLMITNVKGEFRTFTAELVSDGDSFDAGSITAEFEADSIFTNNDDRDKHLKSADFFDAENHKKLTFQGSKLEKQGGYSFKLTGKLTIKGVSKEVTLDVNYGGIMTDPWGNKKAGFSFSGQINRTDWGLNWNAALEAGGVLVSEAVKIDGEIQFAEAS